MTIKRRVLSGFVGLTGRFLFFIFLSVLHLGCVHAQEKDRASDALSPKRVEIPNTQALKINSAIVGQEYDLYVHLPRFYDDTTKAFPVLYLLDAQWDFPLLAAIFGEQYYDGFIPGIIIVGITWGGENPNHDGLRARDLTPTKIPQAPQSGNAPKFLDFIKKELIPFIDSKFRTAKNDRTLMGSSLGGLFTLYALFQETELFNRYVLTSPAVGWDNEAIYAFEKNYADKKSKIPVKLFMAIGGLEGLSGFQKLADHLIAQKYEGLALQTRVLENIGHSGSKAEGFARGLQAVFERPSLKLAPAILDRYTGVYQLNPMIKVEIAREEDHLVLITPEKTRLALHAETENDFYVNGTYLFIRYKKDGTGKLTGMELEQFNGESFLQKVN